MDLNAPSWFGQLTLSRNHKPETKCGSIAEITRTFMLELRNHRTRALGESKEITITFRDKPFDAASTRLQTLSRELDTQLQETPDDSMKPMPDESPEDFLHRMAQIIGINAATSLVADWFSQSLSLEATGWIADPDMIRLRELTTSIFAFEKASVAEYRQLVSIARLKYPSFFANLTLRIAD